MTKAFAWSFSALTRYETCPKQYYHLNVIKDFQDTGSEASNDGNIIHDALAKRIGKKVPLPLEQRHLESIASRFAALPGDIKVEMKLALNNKFEPVGYFDRDVWVRVVIDYLNVQDTTAIMVDWKTGKRKPDFTQLGLSAAVLARWMPEVELIKTMYVWTGQKAVDPKNYTLSKLTNVWDEMLPRVKKMEQAAKTTDFPAKPSGLCKKYCVVKSCPHYQIGSR